MARARAGEPRRFIEEVIMPYEGDDCITWPFSVDNYGYARFNHGHERSSRPVCRYVCERIHGPPPTPSHQAAHSCGRGKFGCVTKGHLSWKTPLGNSADTILHGKSTRGETHVHAKLTNEAVLYIRAMRGKEAQRSLARRFGVSQMLIYLVQTRKGWAWLEDKSVA